MPSNLSNFGIEIHPIFDKRYKSIGRLTWNDIPGFAILTGRNGSGKTQLLELLAHFFSGTLSSRYSASGWPVQVNVTGITYSADEIGYIPSEGRFSGGTSASLANMPHIRNQAVSNARNLQNYTNDITGMVRAKRILKKFEGNSEPTTEEINKYLSDDYEFTIDDVDITSGITHVFMAHRFKILESLERNTPGLDRNGQEIGPAPWDIVNEALHVSGFPYDVVSPQETSLIGSYDLRLRDRLSGNEIGALDLSSGEKVLLQLVLWLFTAGKDGLFPKLLLLDEPDAHLHPSMTTQFLDVISEVLVNRYGVRVIMTTHSPSTVALAPEGSVFELARNSSTVKPTTNRADIISVLTAGLVTVSRATKFCFVEDQDDVAFYQAVYEVLIDHGPSRDPMALSPSPTIAFIPASIGSGATKISGGASVVRKWVEKLDTDPLERMFLGIVDRDVNNQPTARVQVLGRYSFENYILDPVTIFGLLLENGTAPPLPSPAISAGDEHLLRMQNDTSLQAIANEICGRMEAIESNLAVTTQAQVIYSTGQKIHVPAWVIDYRGHDLLRIAQSAFGGPGIVNPPRLIRTLRRVRLLPVELATTLATVQKT